MKRTVLLVLIGALGVAMLLYPAFRRAVFQRFRFILLILSGALLTAALGRLLVPGAGPPLTADQRIWGSAGALLLAVCFGLVLFDTVRKSSQRE